MQTSQRRRNVSNTACVYRADTVFSHGQLLRVKSFTDVSYSIRYPVTAHETLGLLVKVVFSFAHAMNLPVAVFRHALVLVGQVT